MTELDKLLIKTKTDKIIMNDFYKLFLMSKIYIPTYNISEINNGENKLNAGDTFEPVIITSKDKEYLILFDTQERLNKYATRKIGYVKLLGLSILQMMPEGIYWAVNHLDYYKEFSPEEIKWLKNNFVKQSPIIFSENTQMLIGKPKVVNKQLIKDFIYICKYYPEIKSAYLGQTYIQEVSQFPFFTLVINTIGVSKDIENTITQHFSIASKGLTNNINDLIAVRIDKNVEESSIIMKEVEPFYITK